MAAGGASDSSSAAGASEYASKADFDKMHSQFAEFTDLVTKSFLTKGDDMRTDQVATVVQAASAAASGEIGMTAEEIAEAGFDDKQARFVNNLVNKVATNVAKSISSETVSQAQSQNYAQVKMNELDNEAYEEFPDLKNKQSEHYKLTDRLMKEQRAFDKTADARPDFLLANSLRAKKILEKQSVQKNISTNDTGERRRFDAFSLEVGSHSSGIDRAREDANLSPERKTLRGLLRG